MLSTSRRSVVMLHGWGYTPRVWAPLIHALFAGGDDISVECPDIADVDADLSSSIREGSIIVGWSLGGMRALDLASRHPDKCASLVLIGTTPRFVQCSDWQNGLAADTVDAFRRAFESQPNKTMRRFLALQALNDAKRPLVTSMLESTLADSRSNHATLQQGLALLFESDLRDRLPTDIPCTIIHGKHDAVVPASAGQWLHQHLPGSRIHVLDEVGHAPHVSEPEVVATFIRKACSGR